MTKPDPQDRSQQQEGPDQGEVFTVPIGSAILDFCQAVGPTIERLAGISEFVRVSQAEPFQRIIAQALSVNRTLVIWQEQIAPDLVQLGQQAVEISQHLAESFQVSMGPFQDVLTSLADQAQQFQTIYAAIRDSYLAPLQAFTENIYRQMVPVIEGLERTRARLLENALRRYHWWPVPGLPFEFYEELLQLIETDQMRQINRYTCDWFGWNRYRRLGRMMRRWDSNPYFRRRRPIYRQALQAHRRGWYNVTVLALVPLVEGIARDYLSEVHNITQRSGRRAIEQALDRNAPQRPYLEELQQALIRFLTSSTFADTDDVLPSGYELNRHGVAHSRHLRYGTEANSLRCFLLLETLFQYMMVNASLPAIW